MLPGKKIFLLFTAIFFTLQGKAYADEVWAADVYDLNHKRQEVITKSVIADGEKEGFVPEEKYKDQNGKEYWLKNWHMEPYQISERREWAERTVLYEDVEWESQIPKQVPISMSDKVTGQKLENNYSILKKDIIQERWLSGFSFTAVFHSYDADYYLLGNKKIPFNSNKPEIKNCKEELLEEIGVESEKYRIIDAFWKGAPYTDNNGSVCRDALITGEKKVADYYVTYGGNVVFPETQGYQCVAVYQGFSTVTEGWSHAEEQSVEAGNSSGSGGEKKESWLIFRKNVVVTLSIILVGGVIGTLVFLIKKFGRNRKEKEEEHEENYR